ncbi:MAG: hypothetical protein ACI3XQ_04565 [Eubacteriales bacterium]
MIIGTKTDFENLADFILRDYLGNDYDCYKPLDIQAFAENYLKLNISFYRIFFISAIAISREKGQDSDIGICPQDPY